MTQQRTHKTSDSTLQTFIYENATATYIAKAPTYATTNSAMWQIKLIDETSSNATQIKWAGGTQDFNNVLDNYLSLTYK